MNKMLAVVKEKASPGVTIKKIPMGKYKFSQK